MDLLKKENWWIWLIIFLVAGNIYPFILGALLNVYKKDAWYTNITYWMIGFLFFIIPGFIMFWVFSIQTLATVAAKLNVEGKEFYLSPYIWILLAIIPILGWISMGVLTFYLQIMILINLKNGDAEKYI
jgi:hypothetical protein